MTKLRRLDPMKERGIRTMGTIVQELKKASRPSGRDADPRRTLPLTSSKWRKLRAYILNESPLCEECQAPATDVDHIDGDPGNNSMANLQALCHACHSRKTAHEMAGTTRPSGARADGWPTDPSHHWNR